MFRKWLIRVAAVALVAVATFGVTQTASAQWGFGIQFGHGHYGHHGHHGGYYGGRGGYGGIYGHRSYYPRWHDTSHWDYHPGYHWRHGNHYHYEPGHYHWHRDGHWHR